MNAVALGLSMSFWLSRYWGERMHWLRLYLEICNALTFPILI
jgi:hypothetical protein